MGCKTDAENYMPNRILTEDYMLKIKIYFQSSNFILSETSLSNRDAYGFDKLLSLNIISLVAKKSRQTNAQKTVPKSVYLTVNFAELSKYTFKFH